MEYMSKVIEWDTLDAELTALGKNGWRVIHMQYFIGVMSMFSAHDTPSRYHVVFERMIPNG